MLAEVLHELIDAARHALTPNRIGELHELVNGIEDTAKGAEETAPPAPQEPAE